MNDETNIDIDGIKFHEAKLMNAIENANIQYENTTDPYESEQILLRLDSLENELDELHNNIGGRAL